MRLDEGESFYQRIIKEMLKGVDVQIKDMKTEINIIYDALTKTEHVTQIEFLKTDRMNRTGSYGFFANGDVLGTFYLPIDVIFSTNPISRELLVDQNNCLVNYSIPILAVEQFTKSAIEFVNLINSNF